MSLAQQLLLRSLVARFWRTPYSPARLVRWGTELHDRFMLPYFVERLQVKATGLAPDRYVIACNGRRLPLRPTGTVGEFVAGVRYKAWKPASALHPTRKVDAPLTFDLLDTWMNRSLGGCQYHVMHPGGRNYATFPVNAFESESRRLARFFRKCHTPGTISAPPESASSEYPFTLDLRAS
jgi:uncharacterized protein (DUF2126 family)